MEGAPRRARIEPERFLEMLDRDLRGAGEQSEEAKERLPVVGVRRAKAALSSG